MHGTFWILGEMTWNNPINYMSVYGKKSLENTLVPTLMALMNRKKKSLCYTMYTGACRFLQICVFWVSVIKFYVAEASKLVWHEKFLAFLNYS